MQDRALNPVLDKIEPIDGLAPAGRKCTGFSQCLRSEIAIAPGTIKTGNASDDAGPVLPGPSREAELAVQPVAFFMDQLPAIAVDAAPELKLGFFR